MTNYYAVLGVRPNASFDEIRSAYRLAARQAHPDLDGNAERFRKLQAAYEALRDPTARQRYDEARCAWMRQLGAVCCAVCGHANRIIRQPTEREIVRCWHCKTPLQLAWNDLLQAQRQSLLHETSRFVEEVGIDLADLATDAVRAGIARLRQRIGLTSKQRLKP